MTKKLILLGIIFLLSACGRISIYKYKAHVTSATDLSGPQISILHVTRNNYVNEIDGKGKYSPSHVSDAFPYSGAEIELLPGMHTLSMSYRSSISYSKKNTDISFNFSPGRIYFLHSNIDYRKNEAGGLSSYVNYQIDECGTTQETNYNVKAKEADNWLAPYVPACGK